MGYAGPFNADFRSCCCASASRPTASRSGVPVTATSSITAFMVDEGTIGDWAHRGPAARRALGAERHHGDALVKWPLLIDPQGQGLSWIKRREEANSAARHPAHRQALPQPARGRDGLWAAAALENVEEVLDPLLDPVLDKAIQRSGRNLKIQLADKECEYSETFRMFLVLEAANPHFSPELSRRSTVINFTVTMARPRAAAARPRRADGARRARGAAQKLVEEVNANKQDAQGARGRLALPARQLDRQPARRHVADRGAADVQGRRRSRSRRSSPTPPTPTSASTSRARSTPRRDARLAALLPDRRHGGASTHVPWSRLQQFLELFDFDRTTRRRRRSRRSASSTSSSYVTFHVTCYMQRGLFERHKTIWTLMLAMKMQQVAGKLSAGRAGAAQGRRRARPQAEKAKPADWMPDPVWLNVPRSSRARCRWPLARPARQLRSARNDAWRAWYDHDARDPKVAHPRLQRAARDVLREAAARAQRCARTARCSASQEYISGALGKRYIDSRPLDLGSAVRGEATAYTPIITLLSQGSDPTASSRPRAQAQEAGAMISMGQGQEPAARKLIDAGRHARASGCCCRTATSASSSWAEVEQ